MYLKHLKSLLVLSICLLALTGCKETYTFNPSEISKVTAQKHGNIDTAKDLTEDQISHFIKAIKEAKEMTDGNSSAIGSPDELILTDKNGKATEMQVFYYDSTTKFLDGDSHYQTQGESAVWKELGLQK
ncbi:hypothetical protein [Paenibacillus sp. FJAT-26967]|uniref:hypothetical protein n=1 Tax=Paenibacillus sp. FJAT-26967 TaxID=1729690 RepID=UPI0008395914|nr:hypothetical protein [Paenibacillus sp. FJAT-26967]